MGNDDGITVLTGATGFVGSLVLERLIARGSSVVALVRADSDDEALARLVKLAERTWGDSSMLSGVQAIAADLESEGLGLEPAAYRELAARAGAIVHCAASVRFDLSEAEANAINVAGAERMVELAELAREQGASARFIHLSTAYVHGRSREIGREDGPSGVPEHRNTYELTKHRAEAVVGRLEGAVIIRPSIIVGDSVSGWTSSFNVVYAPLRALVSGALTAVPATPEALLDAVPVDQVVDLVMAMLDSPSETGVIHAVSGETAPTVLRFAQVAAEHAGIAVPDCDPEAAAQIGPYAPYTDVLHPFELGRARAFGLEPVPVENLVPLLLDHAFAAKWGRIPIPRAAPIPAST